MHYWYHNEASCGNNDFLLCHLQESDSIEQTTTSPIKAPKPKMKAPLSKIKSVKNSSPRKNIVVSEDDDDEVETSLSDELNHSVILTNKYFCNFAAN